jgi:DNA-binding transcriptional ArsR family regulator
MMDAGVAETFAALGDPVRNAIVDTLVAGDATVGELAALFAITLQAVSQQIGTLERAGLVTRHREGRTRRVHLEMDRLEQAATWMEIRRRRLEERYQRLDEVLSDVLEVNSAPRSSPGTLNTRPSHPRKDRP